MEKGKLYLVPTPIGNLQDITLRALETLKQVDLIGAEDTRHSRNLLQHYHIETPLCSYHKYNEKKRSSEFLNKLQRGKSIAIISDAGTPGISDPAAEIVKEARKIGIKVEALPGASALLPALTASGFSIERFCFLGFLPHKKKDKEILLQELSSLPHTLVFYTAPHDLLSFAAELLIYLQNREVCLARELTKVYEEYIYTSLQELAEQKTEFTLKGEFTVIVKGRSHESVSNEELKDEILNLKKQKISSKVIIKMLTEKHSISPNSIKKILFSLK